MLAKCKYYGWAKQIGNVAATARTARVATNNFNHEDGNRASSYIRMQITSRFSVEK